jgi:monoamine oxidase
LNWLYGDRIVDDATLVIGFGWVDPAFDPENTEHVERALTSFFPDAELLSHTSHDWVSDPASRGTWVNSPAGHPEVLDPENFAPTGRLAFATSDIAAEHSGWFEGALVSGKAAAQAINTLLS